MEKAQTTTNEDGLFQALEQIARSNIAGIATLRTQNSDSLDFHDIAVWELMDALEAAYELGRGNRDGGDAAHLPQEHR